MKVSSLLVIQVVLLLCSYATGSFDYDYEEKSLFSCQFSCPNGAIPTPKQNYTPEVNGCGSFNINFDFSIISLDTFNDCCHRHDYCYRTCNTKRSECDDIFYKDLKAECNKMFSKRSSQRGLFDWIKLKCNSLLSS